jgi:outer membrane cobalamin receptor
MKRKLLVIFLFCMGVLYTAQAQTEKKHYSIKGFVYEHETGKPIEMAYVTLPDLTLWGTTDSGGKFVINRILPGTTTVEISCLGYQTVKMDIIIERDLDSLVFRMKEENLQLESVTVTATESKSALTTTTRMDRQAIDHLQVINPTDIMSLLPGGKTVNPDLMDESIFSLRGGDGNGAFGTAVEVDGIRLSSNSNLTGMDGVDTRNLSASNFESIEVITGVPSVEYGDMTAGMVVIRTKKGRSPYSVTVSLNPTTKQFSLSKGYDLKKDRGILNVNAEYAHAYSNPVSRYTTYFRNGYGISYSNTFNRNKRPLRLNVNVGGGIGRQEAKADPDAYDNVWSSKSDNSLRFGANANWLINSRFITSLDFNVSASYKDDYSEQNEYFSYATIRPAVNVMEDGYYETNYLPAQFYNLMSIDSKSLNMKADIKATLNKRYGSVLNRFKAGIGWSSNGNLGDGEDYERNLYPDGFRPRPYTDIPFMHNINGYLENNATIPIGKTTLSLIAGVRIESNIIEDMSYNQAISASPRFNGRYTIVDNKKRSAFLRQFSIRGAWGMLEKLPGFSVLYPMDKYRDIIVYSKNYGTENQYYNVAKTNVFRDYFNPDLEWSRSRNIELGLDANVKGVAISVVYYNNKAKNPYITESYHVPYTYSKTDENYDVPDNPSFRVDKNTGDIFVTDLDNPAGGETLIPKSVNDTIFIQNAMQANGEPSTRQGVELSIDFGKIESIRTSFKLDASYNYSKEVNERLNSSYTRRPHSTLPTNLGRSYEFAAFYLGGTSQHITYNGAWADGINANLTATTHIPEIRMTVSLRLEGTLYSQSQKLTYFDGEEWAYLLDENGNKLSRSVYDQKEYFSGVWPVAYMGFDQKVHPFTATEAADPRFAYMIGQSNNVYTFARDGNGPYFMANLSLTKEIGDLASISFYVNNFTKSNPYIRSWATGIESARNIGFAYGATLRLKF